MACLFNSLREMAMRHNTIEKTSHHHLPKSPDSHPEENIKKISMLFTDIVGSTKYFKLHGDQAGRLMLARHFNVASEIIHEFRGCVIKSLGDSVMAYFVSPGDALMAAVKMQQKYSSYNQVRNASDQVHIRISVHSGYGIIEENDIYGDVVNVTAKLTTLAESDQVYVSQQVYDEASDMNLLQFELIDTSNRQNVPDGLVVYRVIWDETVRFDPIMTTIIYIKPVWELTGDYFRKAWHGLLDKKHNLWNEKIEKRSILPDRSIVLNMKEDFTVIDMACNIAAYLQNNFIEEKASSFIPVNIIIDSGPYLRADRFFLNDLVITREEMETGKIYISFTAYDTLKKHCVSLPALLGEASKSGSFFKLNINLGQEEEKLNLFLYHDALIQGENRSCFYCGSKKHPATKCPSKELPEITNGIEQIGYKSVEEINKVYLDYLMKPISGPEELAEGGNSSIFIAHQAFYDLKKIFQLRFFRTIWGSEDKLWDSVKKRLCGGSRSGITWIAQDCIRVSELQKAESLLEDALIGSPDDYKVYCALGFLNVERNNLSRAEQFFDQALMYARTKPEKIFLRFLLFRIHELNNNSGKAADVIKEILTINPQCSEAVYLDIVLQFHGGGTTEPLRRLLKLIQSDRDYYVYALIDPELKSFKGIINLQLKELLDNVRDDARRVFRETEEELKRVRHVLSRDKTEMQKVDDSWLKIKNLAETNSYYGSLDVIYHGLAMTKTMHRAVGEHKKELSEDLLKYTHRIRMYLKFIAGYHNKIVTEPLYQRLEYLQKMVHESWRKLDLNTSNDLMNADKSRQLVSEEIERIDQKMKKLLTIHWMRMFFYKFMKRNLIFILITFLAALILMPIIVFYVNLVLIKLNMPQIHHIWFYQKMIMSIGSACGILLSFLITCVDVPKKDFILH